MPSKHALRVSISSTSAVVDGHDVTVEKFALSEFSRRVGSISDINGGCLHFMLDTGNCDAMMLAKELVQGHLSVHGCSKSVIASVVTAVVVVEGVGSVMCMCLQMRHV